MGWVQQIPQDKVHELNSYSFPWTCKGLCFLRHIPSRQVVLSEIIVVMQLPLQNKPAFVSSLDIAGTVLWLEGWVKIQIMPTDAGVVMQQAWHFPGNILLLFSLCVPLLMHLCLLCYVLLKFWLLKLLLSYWTFCYLHHGAFPSGKTACSALDRSFHTRLPWVLFAHILLSRVKASN